MGLGRRKENIEDGGASEYDWKPTPQRYWREYADESKEPEYEMQPHITRNDEVASCSGWSEPATKEEPVAPVEGSYSYQSYNENIDNGGQYFQEGVYNRPAVAEEVYEQRDAGHVDVCDDNAAWHHEAPHEDYWQSSADYTYNQTYEAHGLSKHTSEEHYGYHEEESNVYSRGNVDEKIDRAAEAEYEEQFEVEPEEQFEAEHEEQFEV